MEAKYKRVILKISGEALSSPGENIDFDIVGIVAKQVAEISDMGVEVCIIVGGGNIWRGRQGKHMDRVTADHMGMLATVINSLAIQDAFIRRKAVRHLEKGRIVIFACGTGNPYFTTDTATALRAAEMEADLILLAKNVDGVYDSDPKKNPDAKKFDEISYLEVISRGLQAMDTTAVTLCMENNIPILAFGLSEKESIKRAVLGEKMGTLIR